MVETEFSLEKFLGRIGLDPARDMLTTDVSSLSKLTRAFTMTVPFEQMDVALGRGVDTSVQAIFNKIVLHNRGGYCFENNLLMHTALLAMGFDARYRLARVLLGPRPSSFTHLVNLVRIDNAEWLVDVGFGTDSLRAPLALGSVDKGTRTISGIRAVRRVGAAVLMHPDVYRLVDDGGESELFPGAFRLQSFSSKRWAEAGMPAVDSSESDCCWKDQYAFHPEQPVADADITIGSYYVSTRMENNWFTNCRLAVLLTPGGRKILHNNTLTTEERIGAKDLCAMFASYVSKAGEDNEIADSALPISRTRKAIPEDEWFEVLQHEFGVDLDWDHRTGLAEKSVQILDFFPGAQSNDAEFVQD